MTKKGRLVDKQNNLTEKTPVSPLSNILTLEHLFWVLAFAKNVILTTISNKINVKTYPAFTAFNGGFCASNLFDEQGRLTAIMAAVWRIYTRFKPHMLMVLVQIGYTVLYFITEASFSHGMNPHVYVTYRHVVSGFVMLPCAYFLERKARPRMTLALAAEIFVLSLLGVGLTLNMYFTSLQCTSPTFVASMVNTISSLTFVIAVALRLEVVDIRKPRGMAKVVGTLVSLVGVTIMTLYKGSSITNIWHPLLHIQRKTIIHENWLKGSVLTVASCITWSLYYIMQAFTLKRYPAPLSLTTWMSFLGAAQSAIFTALTHHKSSTWRIGFNIDLWSTVYGGVVCSGLIIFIQFWCTEEKGPVFVTMFSPLGTIIVAVLAYFVLGEKLYIGSIIGAVIVIFGMYILLWGKEQERPKNTSKTNLDFEDSKNVEPVTQA